MNLSIKGGASKGLAYFQFWKYMKTNNLHFDTISGASAGGLFAALFACLETPEQGKDLMLRIYGDKAMKWQCDIEMKRGSKISRVFKTVATVISMRTLFYLSVKKLLQENVSWEKAKKRGHKLFICVLKNEDLIKLIGSNLFESIKKTNYENLLKDLKGHFNDLECFRILSICRPYFISDDGIYTILGDRFMKINDAKIPLWEAVLGTFWNPILPLIKMSYLDTVFDGGLLCSYATQPFIGKEFYQLTCTPIPTKQDPMQMTGIENCTKFMYLLNPAKKVYEVTPLSYQGFFAFYDENIEKEFNAAVNVKVI